MRIPFVYTSRADVRSMPAWHLDAIEHDVPEISASETRPFDVLVPRERTGGLSTSPHVLHGNRIFTALDFFRASPRAWIEDRLQARGAAMGLPRPPVAGAWTLPYGHGGRAVDLVPGAPEPGRATTRERFEHEAAAYADELVLVDGVLHSSAWEPCTVAAISKAQKERTRTTARLAWRSVLDDWRVRIPEEFHTGRTVPPVVPLHALESNAIAMLSELEFRSGGDPATAVGSWTSRIREADVNCYETLRFVEDRFLGQTRLPEPDPVLLRLRCRNAAMLADYEGMDGTPPEPEDVAALVRDWHDVVAADGAPFVRGLVATGRLPLAVTGSFLDWWERRGRSLAPPDDGFDVHAGAEERSDYEGFVL